MLSAESSSSTSTTDDFTSQTADLPLTSTAAEAPNPQSERGSNHRTSRPSIFNSTKRKRSLAWNHFEKTGDKEATCDICGETVKTAGNTTNLITVIDNIYTVL